MYSVFFENVSEKFVLNGLNGEMKYSPEHISEALQNIDQLNSSLKEVTEQVDEDGTDIKSEFEDIDTLVMMMDPLEDKSENIKSENLKLQFEPDSAEKPFKPLKCRYGCDLSFSRRERYKHEKSEHGQIFTKENKPKKKEWTCLGECGNSSCRKTFNRLDNKKRHIREKTQLPQPCHICGVSFKSEKGLRQHLEEHDGGWLGKSRCRECLKSFAIEEIEAHQSLCKPEFICNVCGKTFIRKAGLKWHMEYAHGELKPVKCEHCEKIFKAESSLAAHIRTIHTKPTEITTCPECGKQVKYLSQHIALVHTADNEKKFQCQDCGKGFVTLKEVKRHQMSAHIKSKPYNCRYGCDIAYNDKSNRNQHERKQHGKVYTSREEMLKEALDVQNP